jgi:hypothetical protein
MLLLFFAFGVLISLALVSSVAAFDIAGCSPPARHALPECHGQVHGKRLFNYSSVDHYKGSDFLNDS